MNIQKVNIPPVRPKPKTTYTFDNALFLRARTKHMAFLVIVGFVIGGFAMWFALKHQNFENNLEMWIVTAAFAVLCAVVIAIQEWREQKKVPARIKEYLELGDIADIPLERLVKLLGKPTSRIKVRMVDRDDEPGEIVVWKGCSYYISICFDSELKAVSIRHEKLPVQL